jgi:DNA-binding transcriptional ArsR family regulator
MTSAYSASVTRAARKVAPVAAKPEHPDVPTEDQLNAAVTAFALLADPTRVRILWSLRETPLDVTTLAEAASCKPTIASQHLAKLLLAGLVERTRNGRRIIYSVRGSHVRNLLTEALFHADHQVSGEPTHD